MKQLLLFVALIISLCTFAQHSIQSTVLDSKNGLPIELGTVRLLRSSDSALVQGCQTDSRGGFILNKIKPGSYKLVVSSVGYLDYRKVITVDSKDLILKSIQLAENVKVLNEVLVTGVAAQMVVKGDTMEYNATAFKTTQNAVVEDLLKRLPGVEISTDGKITVNGEEIKKIRVNGKKFFSDDVEMATKNIPADLIDKIQVLDQKSDMATLTGFEDNDTERIINLTFKPNRKKGTFGNVSASAGADSNDAFRYDSNFFLNFINGESQTTLTGAGNNTNTSKSSRGRGGYSNNSGITSTQNFGVNNNTLISDKTKVGGDGSYNHAANETITESNRESYLANSIFTDKSKTTSHSDSYSANMRLELEWKLDSMNTIVFQPDMSYNNTLSDSKKNYLYLTDNDSTSWGETNNFGNNTTINGGLDMIYSHKFTSKKGRTFTANFNSDFSQSDNETTNISDKYTTTDLTQINQQTNTNSNKYNFKLRMSLVEPLWNARNLLETSVSLRSTKNLSDKNQNGLDSAGNYTVKNNEYSNNFENNFYSQTLEMNYRYVTKTINLMLGMKGEPSQTYSYTLYGDQSTRDVSNKVFNFAPTARLQYYFSKKKFARLDYRGETDQPSISQLQPVKDNSNLMNETVGNPSLNPAFSHRLRMMYSSFNDKTFTSFNTYLSAEATKDALVLNSLYDNTGKQYSQTVNAEKIPYNVRANIMFNTPLIQKRLHFNTSTSLGFDQRYGYSSKGLNNLDINTDTLTLGSLSNTQRYYTSENLSLTFTHDVIEIGIKGGIKYSNTWNNLSTAVAETYDWSGAGNVNLHLPFNINIGSDITYTNLVGYSSFDQSQLIWNATMDKTIFKNKGVISFKMYDILHQQLNIRQTIGDNYIQYNNYNTLTTYFLVGLTYKINKFKGKSNPAEMEENQNRFGPGDGKGRPDGAGRPGGGQGRPDRGE